MGRGGAGERVRLPWVFAPDAGLEQRLQVYHEGMFARRDQILEMEVGGFEGVEQREVAALPPVKAPDFIGAPACRGRYEFRPAVAAPLQDFERRKWRLRSSLVEPGQQLLKAQLDGQRARLIDHPKPVCKLGDQHRPPASVRVADAARHFNEHARLFLHAEGRRDVVPVGAEVSQELAAFTNSAAALPEVAAGLPSPLLDSGDDRVIC